MKYFVKRKNIIEHFAHEIAKLQWKADNFYNDGNKEMSSYILSKSDALMKLASNIGIGKEVYIRSIEIYDYRNSGREG